MDLLALEKDLKIQSKSLEESVKSKTKDLKNFKKTYKDLDKIAEYSQMVVEDRLSEIKEKIEPVINSLLKTVFVEEDLSFRFRSDVKYGKTSFIPEIVDEAKGVCGSVDTTGGGVMVLSSIILKMMFIMLEKKARVLVLDETLNPVSPEYRSKSAEFISKIAKELGFDILLITFDEGGLIGSHADNVYKVIKNGLYSEIKKITS